MPAAAGREDWSSGLVFLLAALGSAVGLGNLWRFPYLAGQYGGGAFVLVYLFFSIAICAPLVMAELAMGRRGHRNPLTTMRTLCAEEGRSRFWHSIGWLSIFPTLGVLCFYSVVAGWSLYYIAKAAAGAFVDIGPEAAESVFIELQSAPVRMFFWHSVYMAATVFVVARGLRGGIEIANKLMMPGLVLSLVVLVVYAHVAGEAWGAWRFMFRPDFSALSAEVVLMALGQALASVSVATGAFLTYGSYVPRGVRLASASWTIALGDTAVSLLAGVAIFSVVLASELDPASGPGLMFLTLPIAIGNLPGGYFFSIVFFVLVFFAAFASSLSMLEPCVSWLVDKGHRRARATLAVGAAVWILATGSVLSFNVLREFTPLAFIPGFEGRTIFGILEHTAANLILPVNALLIALFAGWVLRRALVEEIGISSRWATACWSLAIRYLAPVAIVSALVYGLG
jgi:NSS family neurotransmitter:Na+ symporter